ncbi:MAG: phytoene/squalene synthase family protein [Gammaproteobacteria bacterium]
MDAVVSNSRDMIRKGSRSFALASRLFDSTTRDDAWMLYAWCRHCDDEIDGQELGMLTARSASALRPMRSGEAAGRLERLRVQTHQALAGNPGLPPPFMGLQRVAREHMIPEQYPLELLAGFEMDVSNFRYETLDQTMSYCYRVAGVVGVMMALVMGVRKRPALQRAADLGIAFQLTNISRDVIDDALNGRCYLPLEWLSDVGMTPEAVGAAGNRKTVAALVERLLAEADRYYQSATAGLQSLSFRSAWAVATALGVYRDIGRVVRHDGAHAWDQRAVVSLPRKLWQVSNGAMRAIQAVTVDRRRHEAPRASDLWLIPD